MAKVTVHRVPKDQVFRIWPLLYEGVLTYIEKTPHEIGTPQEVLRNWLSPEGDQLLVVMLDAKQYLGFASYKVLDIEGERWATFAMIYLPNEFASFKEAIPEAMRIFKREGCTHVNYFTARKGFARLAPRLGFRPRITEWVAEVN
jgi:hypothetical protein